MKTFIKKHVKSYKVLGHAHYFVVYAYIIKETEPDLRGSILLFIIGRQKLVFILPFQLEIKRNIKQQ